MANKIGRNDPCWCGSGKKYKLCHLPRSKKPWRIAQLDKLLRSTYRRGRCLHPDASDLNCQGGVIDAHSISESALRKVARNGHVYGVNFKDAFSIHERSGNLSLDLLGVGKASTFRGFCAAHDCILFQDLEAESFRASPRQILLLGYRSVCRSLYGKRAIIKNLSRTREVLHHYPPSRVPYLVNFSLEIIRAHSPSLDRLEEQKKLYDKQLAAGDSPALCSTILYFSECPELLCSEFFTPEHDFEGGTVQDISRGDYESIAGISFTLIPLDCSGGAAVFSWLPIYSDVGNQFIDSLLARGGEIPSLLVRLSFELSDNFYLNPSWWEAVPERDRDELLSLLQHGISRPQASDTLSAPLNRDLVKWNLMRVRQH